VSSRTTESSPPITFKPQFEVFATPGHAGTPDHVCLIAVVSAGLYDPISGTWDPLTDRHYAQHNLDVLHVDAGGVSPFSFFIGNPFGETARVIASVRPATSAENGTLSAVYGSQAGDLPAEALRLMTATGEGARQPARELQLELKAGERRLCQGLVSTAGLRPGEFVAAQVDTNAAPLRGDGRAETRGSFGVVVFVR
jgi:hypothetical protein